MILETLQHYKSYAESQGLIVFSIALKGSQNYNLADEDSDIDANLIFIPTLAQLRDNSKFKFTFDTGEVTCHNVYQFASIVAKGNPQWVEVCHSDYKIGNDLSLFKHYQLNPSALKGMVMEKVTAFSKLYPSRAKFVNQFGYDPKQLHHIIRLFDCLDSNNPVFRYEGQARQHMLDIKRGRFPSTLAEAEALRDFYISKINAIYADRKLSYQDQPINYAPIDAIVMQHLVDYYKNSSCNL